MTEPLTEREQAFEQIMTWIRGERAYQAQKWDYEHEPERRATDEGWWFHNGIVNNWGRIRLYGVRQANGRQAAAKIITTLVHMLEIAIVQYGPLPKPGLSSGNIEEWDGATLPTREN